MGFSFFIFTFLVLPNAYAGLRIFTLWPWANQNAFLFWALFAVFVLVQFAGPFGERLFFPNWRTNAGLDAFIPALNWAAYMAYGILSIFVFYTVIGDIVRIIWLYFSPADDTVDFDRRMILTLGVATAATTAVGIWQAGIGHLKIVRVDVPIDNLRRELDGFTIAQLSDLHVGPIIGRSYAQSVVNAVNGLNADMVALTGDFVDSSIPAIADDIAPLAELRSRHGSFYVTGNHEYYCGAEEWQAHFKKMGIHVLANEHNIIEHDGAPLAIAGVNDYSTLKMSHPNACDPQKAVQGVPEGIKKILLAHQPITFTLAEAAGVDLQLSGHTHAGQYFPFSMVIRFFQRYYKGLNRHGNMWIYVNSATGYWGPPLRAGVPAEITLLTLRSRP